MEMSVLNYLYNMEVLTDHEQEILTAMQNPVAVRHQLLRYLYRKPYDKQQLFVVALEDSQQIHLAESIRASLQSQRSTGELL